MVEYTIADSHHYRIFPPIFSIVLKVPNPNIAITNSITTSKGICGPVIPLSHCNHGLKVSGVRSRNSTILTYRISRLDPKAQLDLARKIAWIHPDQAKARKAIAVPLNADAMAVLIEARGKHDKFVFTYLGNPVKAANTQAFKKAVERAGITDLRCTIFDILGHLGMLKVERRYMYLKN